MADDEIEPRGVTSPYGWPYPEPTAPVEQGSADIKALGQAIAVTLNKAVGALAVQAGSTVLTTNGGGQGAIIFPVAFKQAYTSLLCESGDYASRVDIHQLGAPANANAAFQFQANAINTTNPTISAAVRVNWIAIGVPA